MSFSRGTAVDTYQYIDIMSEPETENDKQAMALSVLTTLRAMRAYCEMNTD